LKIIRGDIFLKKMPPRLYVSVKSRIETDATNSSSVADACPLRLRIKSIMNLIRFVASHGATITIQLHADCAIALGQIAR
jgi:hypothetical protein